MLRLMAQYLLELDIIYPFLYMMEAVEKQSLSEKRKNDRLKLCRFFVPL